MDAYQFVRVVGCHVCFLHVSSSFPHVRPGIQSNRTLTSPNFMKCITTCMLGAFPVRLLSHFLLWLNCAGAPLYGRPQGGVKSFVSMSSFSKLRFTLVCAAPHRLGAPLLASGRAHKQPRSSGNSGIPLSVQIGSEDVLIVLVEEGGLFVIPLTVGQAIDWPEFLSWAPGDVLPMSVYPSNVYSFIPCIYNRAT